MSWEKAYVHLTIGAHAPTDVRVAAFCRLECAPKCLYTINYRPVRRKVLKCRHVQAASMSFRNRCVCTSGLKGCVLVAALGTGGSTVLARAARCEDESMVPHTASNAASARP